MYLSNFNWGNIFVIEFKNEDLVQRPLTKFMLILGLCLFASSNMAQENITIRPGDINNDGHVNRHDALFWGLAYDKEGASRFNPTSDFFDEQTLPIESLWENNFYNGLNFSYADCNGDGKVDDLDFEEGILDNLFEITEGALPWIPNQASSPNAPTIFITTDVTEVSGGNNITFDVYINSPQDIEDFTGVSFVIDYNQFQIVDNSIKFEPIANGWLGDTTSLKYFSREWDGFNNDDKRTEVAIIKRGQASTTGQGLIGKLSIVMEDIVIISQEVEVELQNAVIMAQGNNPISAYGSTHTFNQQIPTSTTEINKNNFKIFPNPVKDILRIEAEDINLLLEKVEVTAANGQQVDYQNLKSQSISSVDLDWSKYASGLYFLKITTSEGIEVRKLTLTK
ncbi:MAG: T9SS type A sorting domain-containing protein [Saprospiraceae bacterium]|nr:T9SS type A sorting domain-containing protein [Saprospiraceae bacterium]